MPGMFGSLLVHPRYRTYLGPVRAILTSVLEPPVLRDPSIVNRPVENYGDIRLSVQANAGVGCRPRSDMPRLSDYSHVEIALWRRGGDYVRPSQLGIEGLDAHFDGSCHPIAAYVPQAQVRRLREALRQRAQSSARTA